MGLSFVKLFSRLFAKKEMPILMDELRDTVLLVFANKQDLSNATNATEITDKLGLHSLRQRHCTCATSGECLYEGLDWLSNNIARQSLSNQSMMLFTSNKG